MTRTLFLDRDGVILHQPQHQRYVNNLFDAHFEDLSLKALIKLRKQFDRIIVVSNQAGIGYGYTTAKDQREINDWIAERVFFGGGYIDQFYFCPHTIEEKCRCRKPGTLLFERAVQDWQVDLSNSVMIGDQLSDLDAAVAMGAQPVMVLSGNGLRLLCELSNKRNEPEYSTIWMVDPLVTRDLYSYADYDVTLPLSLYAKTTPAPCQKTSHPNETFLRHALQEHIETLRPAMQKDGAARL